MSLVSLILLESDAAPCPLDRVEASRSGLLAQGCEIELIRVSEPGDGNAPAIQVSDRSSGTSTVETSGAAGRGLAVAAIAGLRAARGAYLIVLDTGMDYTPDDVAQVVDRLRSGAFDLVVASRNLPGLATPQGLRARLEASFGRLAGPWLGTTDPFSGLVGLTRPLAAQADETFSPVGSRFTLELIVRTGGRKADVPVAHVVGSRRQTPLLDEIRQLKRLADDKFGNISRLLQFCVVGALGMVVDLTFYALFQFLLIRTPLKTISVGFLRWRMTLDLVFAAALAIGLALTWNFFLNRRLTFNYARHGSILRQYMTYALSNALGIALSFTLRLILPMQFAFFEAHKVAGAVVGIVTATGLNFTMARWLVFRHKVTPVPLDDPEPSVVAEPTAGGSFSPDVAH